MSKLLLYPNRGAITSNRSRQVLVRFGAFITCHLRVEAKLDRWELVSQPRAQSLRYEDTKSVLFPIRPSEANMVREPPSSRQIRLSHGEPRALYLLPMRYIGVE